MRIFLFSLLFLSFAGAAEAQEAAVTFDDASLPRTAATTEKFVPAGWVIETQVSGDLNGDGLPDAALKLIEKPVAAASDNDFPPSRARVLLILLKNKDNTLERATTAKTLLQCTGCGGAFYGVSPAESNIAIAKGILTVAQDSGSREVTEYAYKFRYDPVVKRFALIGYDAATRDRATGSSTVESTNYLTGVKIIENSQYNQKTDKVTNKPARRVKIKNAKLYLETVNYETLAGS